MKNYIHLLFIWTRFVGVLKIKNKIQYDVDYIAIVTVE
jgi:hypothetical protein